VSTGNDATLTGDESVAGASPRSPVRAVETRIDESADACAIVEDGPDAFVLAAWRTDDATIQSRRFACRDGVVRQVGVRNTHHVDGAVGTHAWAREFLDGREQRALAVARSHIDRQGRKPRKPFDGRG
jgi:hypothetical protein